jgi:hypothetical protein
MHVKFLATAAIVLCAATGTLSAQRQLQLLATVTDPSGAPVTTVEPKDVRVVENGVEATILKVEPVDRVPKVQLLIDNGVGMPPESLGDLRNAVRGLLNALPPEIEVTLVATAPQPRFLERATTDRQALLQAVDRIAPDSSPGRFVESLNEATRRIEQDEQDANWVILSLGTFAGDIDVRERDVQQLLDRIQKGGTTVHVVLLATPRTASGGLLQTQVGQAVTQMTGGRYESIAVANRIATLVPEIGAEMAKALGQGSRQFRITVERPGGASGDLGQLGMGVAGRVVSSVAVEQD